MNSVKQVMIELGLVFSNEIYRKIAITTIVIGVFSALSFLITYSFLFGYYFGGSLQNSYSNFEIFRRFVPFHLDTITFTYLMIWLSVSLIMYILKLLFDGDKALKIIALISFAGLHLVITYFFSQEVNLNNFLSLLLIWILPAFLGFISLCIIKGSQSPFRTLSGGLFGIVIFSIIFVPFLNHKVFLPDELTIIFGLMMFFSFGLLPYKKYFNFIFIFPYPFFLIALPVSFTSAEAFFKDLPIIIKYFILLIIPAAISFIISVLMKNKFQNQRNTPEQKAKKSLIRKIISEFSILISDPDPKSHKGGVIILLILLLGIYVMTPRVSIYAAKLVRTYTPLSEIKYESIIIKDLEGKRLKLNGLVVTEQNNVLYISNTNWKLEQVKTDYYHIKTSDS
ncbi:hypothetical protein [Cytobacillus sp. FSL H8-0458]|uniref:hypothetical protein n=1 Tax=Cytobacillus sp. FSL H8-0458 TaxID=2975346 RepID=UPI0030F833CB